MDTLKLRVTNEPRKYRTTSLLQREKTNAYSCPNEKWLQEKNYTYFKAPISRGNAKTKPLNILPLNGFMVLERILNRFLEAPLFSKQDNAELNTENWNNRQTESISCWLIWPWTVSIESSPAQWKVLPNFFQRSFWLSIQEWTQSFESSLWAYRIGFQSRRSSNEWSLMSCYARGSWGSSVTKSNILHSWSELFGHSFYTNHRREEET